MVTGLWPQESHAHAHVCMCVCWGHVCLRMYTHVWEYICVCTQVCVFVCMHTYTCIFFLEKEHAMWHYITDCNLKKYPLGIGIVVFLSCPLVKKHIDLFGSFLY